MVREWLSELMVKKAEAVAVVGGGGSGSGMQELSKVSQTAVRGFGDEAVDGVKAVIGLDWWRIYHGQHFLGAL